MLSLVSLTSRSGSSASCKSRSTMSLGCQFLVDFLFALCSSMTWSWNLSNLALSSFILLTYPCKSKKSSHGIQSPMFRTPLSKNNSSSIS
ncbi:hypothetical protein OIU79_012302 [Salix purpurea]|uniref:Uncharacterized protein n=1 Tax=Salix purpurea TaxID=77065 RepID=A0A9Q0T3B1_SALPP|nr:hypothetical protein OIU79_012302 [Salix purpurea]